MPKLREKKITAQVFIIGTRHLRRRSRKRQTRDLRSISFQPPFFDTLPRAGFVYVKRSTENLDDHLLGCFCLNTQEIFFLSAAVMLISSFVTGFPGGSEFVKDT